MSIETTTLPLTTLANKHEQQKALEDWIAHARGAKFDAEAIALELREYYKPTELGEVEKLYAKAAGPYNTILESLVLALGGRGKTPPDPVAEDKDAIQSAYNKYMAEANRLLDAKLPGSGHLPSEFTGGFVPSIADIGKLIDSIFGIFKFFMQRRKEERDFLISRIDKLTWNQWRDVGKPAPATEDPKKKTPEEPNHS